jgi:hypothetical protein
MGSTRAFKAAAVRGDSRHARHRTGDLSRSFAGWTGGPGLRPPSSAACSRAGAFQHGLLPGCARLFAARRRYADGAASRSLASTHGPLANAAIAQSGGGCGFLDSVLPGGVERTGRRRAAETPDRSAGKVCRHLSFESYSLRPRLGQYPSGSDHRIGRRPWIHQSRDRLSGLALSEVADTSRRNPIKCSTLACEGV